MITKVRNLDEDIKMEKECSEKIVHDITLKKYMEKHRGRMTVLDPTWNSDWNSEPGVGKIVSSPKPHLTEILYIINNGTREFMKRWDVYPTHVNIGRKEAIDLSHHFGTGMENLCSIKCLGMRLVPFFEVDSMLEIERIENEVENEDIPVPYPAPYPPPAPPFPTPPLEKLSGEGTLSTAIYPQYYYTSESRTVDGVSVLPEDKVVYFN